MYAVARGDANAAIAAAGVLSGVYLTPDLDVDNGIRSFTYMPKIITPVWRAFWYPYAKAIKHRSPLSHLPGLGTAIRVAYMATPLFVAGAIDNTHWWFAPWFVGLVVSDTLHWLMDGAPL